MADREAAGSARLLRRLAVAASALALVVVVLGAYTRLVDAGLGCPDWPGCYGFLAVPEAAHEVAAAEARYPDAPLDAAKAWAEMVHRYFAGALGLLIAAIFVAAWIARRRGASDAPLALSAGLLALVVVQAAFGAWTVTLRLWPQVVTAHLLGGFATLTLLWVLVMKLRSVRPIAGYLRSHAAIAIGVLVVQIALGGWTSSNYAALACPDFPTCQAEWWPPMDFARGFDVLQEIGPSYLGGVLHADARAAIHVSHRVGALVVTLVAGALALRLLAADATARRLGLVLTVVLVAQVGLGIANVVLQLPLAIATAHNAMAAILLLLLVSVHWRALQSSTPRGMAQ